MSRGASAATAAVVMLLLGVAPQDPARGQPAPPAAVPPVTFR